MSKLLLSFLFAFVVSGNSGTLPQKCQKFFVTTPDGYVNIRSSPQVRGDNILATLPSGKSVEIRQRQQGWLKIHSPLAGWLAGNQVSQLSCDSGFNLLLSLGLPTITKLGQKAQLGERKASVTLVKMAPYVDGILAEVYAEAIAEWAGQNPNFLVTILNQQNSSIRALVLSSLDFGLGIDNTPERRQFEAFLQRLSPQNPTVRDWQRRNPVYPKRQLQSCASSPNRFL